MVGTHRTENALFQNRQIAAHQAVIDGQDGTGSYIAGKKTVCKSSRIRPGGHKPHADAAIIQSAFPQ